jgi:hypothetical protein
MTIELKSKDSGPSFLEGNSVFRISVLDGEKVIDPGIVTTFEDYERKLTSHLYVSILFVAPIHYKLAYLYDCLNREKGAPRKETFIFYIREIKTREWKEWFVVHPYED